MLGLLARHTYNVFGTLYSSVSNLQNMSTGSIYRDFVNPAVSTSAYLSYVVRLLDPFFGQWLASPTQWLASLTSTATISHLRPYCTHGEILPLIANLFVIGPVTRNDSRWRKGTCGIQFMLQRGVSWAWDRVVIVHVGIVCRWWIVNEHGLSRRQ